MSVVSLGRLEKVEVRDVWTHEASGFTPWLATDENLALLGETIGIDLELEAQEQNVGPFRADILCKDTANDTWVLIENQLAPTDHSHLGQLLTYAAGLHAVTIVWIADRFTDQHRAALDWLNTITAEGINFFGLEIEAWRIGSSDPAPKFNIVAQPNDWSKAVAEGAKLAPGEMTDTKRTQLAYWTGFGEYLAAHSTVFKPPKPAADNWQTFPVGRSGFHLDAVYQMQKKHLRVEFVLGKQARTYYHLLLDDKATIEAAIGSPLDWLDDPNLKRAYVTLIKPFETGDEGQWPQQYAWLRATLETFRTTFEPRVKALPKLPPVAAYPSGEEDL